MSLKFKINVLLFCIYLGTIGNYIIEDIFKFNNADTMITITVDLLVILLTVSFLNIKLRTQKYLYIFILLSTITYFSSDSYTLLSHLNGIRETLVFLCYFVIFEVLFNTNCIIQFNNKFKIFAYTFLIVQIPITILQFLEHGAGDAVGGSFGSGSSGLLSFSIFILIYYLIENKITSRKETLKKGIPFLIFLIPITLNETKISFILLLIFFLSLINLKNIRSTLISIILGVVSIASFSMLYKSQEGFNYQNPLEGIYNKEFLQEYLLGEVNEYYSDVPRFTKIVIGTKKLSEDGDILLGKDYGAFMGSNFKSSSDFAKKNQWFLKGSITYFFYLLITGGVLLILFIIWIVFSEIIRKKDKLRNQNFSPQLLFFIGAIFFVLLLYNDGLRSPIFSFFFVFVLFFAKYFNTKNISSVHPSEIK